MRRIIDCLGVLFAATVLGMSSSLRRRSHRLPPGTSPGTLLVDPEAPKPKLSAFVARDDEIFEHQAIGLQDVASLRQSARNLWLNVEGLGDVALLEQLGHDFSLHPLTLEDVVNLRQRPKVEEYETYLFVVLRMVVPADRGINSTQISLVLGDGFVITFCEHVTQMLAPVCERLRRKTGRLRQRDADYWAYALIDALIDHYFPILEQMSNRLELLEGDVLAEATPETGRQINVLRRELLELRRAIWPLRDELSRLTRSDAFVNRETVTYLRDAHDHSLMLIDMLESLREMASSLMELYLSSVSNRMNEVMKVLTIISTIFIPLTFIAGIYGMNFNTQTSPYNMPELNAYWGYPGAILSMIVTGIGFAGYMWRRGWFQSTPLAPVHARRHAKPSANVS